MMQISVWLFFALIALAVLALCVAGGACGTAARLSGRLRELDPEEREVYVSYELPDYLASAGFRLEGLPNSEVLVPQAYWLVGGAIAEVEYNLLPAQRAFLRVAKEGTMRCADAYQGITYESGGEYDIDGVHITQKQNTGNAVMVTWTRDGYDFMFYATGPQMGAPGGVVQAFVREVQVRQSEA